MMDTLYTLESGQEIASLVQSATPRSAARRLLYTKLVLIRRKLKSFINHIRLLVIIFLNSSCFEIHRKNKI